MGNVSKGKLELKRLEEGKSSLSKEELKDLVENIRSETNLLLGLNSFGSEYGPQLTTDLSDDLQEICLDSFNIARKLEQYL